MQMSNGCLYYMENKIYKNTIIIYKTNNQLSKTLAKYKYNNYTLNTPQLSHILINKQFNTFDSGILIFSSSVYRVHPMATLFLWKKFFPNFEKNS